MEKIISKSKLKKKERNSAIIKEFSELMERGSDKMATYEHLAKKHGIKTITVYNILKKNKEQ